MWGKKVFPDINVQFYTSILKNQTTVSIEDAIFRNESAFVPGNLHKHGEFWEQVILKDHPHKQTFLGWLPYNFRNL